MQCGGSLHVARRYVVKHDDVGGTLGISLEQLLSEVRDNAQKEVDGAAQVEDSDRYVVSILNYFGKWAEDKDAAIVVVEQTHKKLEHWEAGGRHGSPQRVIIDAVKEVGGVTSAYRAEHLRESFMTRSAAA